MWERLGATGTRRDLVVTALGRARCGWLRVAAALVTGAARAGKGDKCLWRCQRRSRKNNMSSFRPRSYKYPLCLCSKRVCVHKCSTKAWPGEV